MRVPTSVVTGLLLSVLAQRPAQAQVARDRRAAEAFPDSIAALSDGGALKAAETALMLRAKRDRSNAGLHYRLGVLALRLREQDDAAAEFKWAAQLDPQWAAAWFRLGQAELALGEMADTTALGRRALLARDAWSRATAAFARAVTIDSMLAFDVERVVLERGRAPSSTVVRDGLRRAVTSNAKRKSALPVLALGRVERFLGDTAAALAAFDLAATMPGGQPLGLLEGARTRLTKGDRAGAEGYFAAAALDDSASVASFRSDIAWVATAEELNRFDRSVGTERASMLAAFWTTRDRADLRNDGERLREHYRRLALASRVYRNRDDQRFAVLIRHGEPDNRAAARPAGIAANESWRYRRAEGELLVHFVASGDTTNYRIVESVFDLTPDGAVASAAGDEKPAATDIVDAMLRSRAQLSPFYQAAAAGRRDQLATFKARERELGRAGRNLALTTDRFPLRFARDLAARVRILAGAAGGQGRVEVAFAIPGFAFDSGGTGSPERSARIRVAVWDSAATALKPLDTTFVWGPSTSADGSETGLVAVAVPAGHYSVRAVIEAGDARGITVGRDLLNIAPNDGRMTLSDVAIGSVGRGAILGPDRPLNVAASFGRAETVVASAVVIGAGADSGLRVRALVRPVTGSGREEKWRSFPGRDGWMSVGSDRVAKLALPLKGLKAGRYELELEVADRVSLSIRERTWLEVVEAGR